MKGLFKITYYIHFISDNGQLSDYIEDFWIWKKPSFNDWSFKKRAEHQNKYNLKSVVVNCGKI